MKSALNCILMLVAMGILLFSLNDNLTLAFILLGVFAVVMIGLTIICIYHPIRLLKQQMARFDGYLTNKINAFFARQLQKLIEWRKRKVESTGGKKWNS